MSWTSYETLAEKVYRRTLPNGLQVMVVPRPGFTKKLCYFVTDFGAIHTEFTMDGNTHRDIIMLFLRFSSLFSKKNK